MNSIQLLRAAFAATVFLALFGSTVTAQRPSEFPTPPLRLSATAGRVGIQESYWIGVRCVPDAQEATRVVVKDVMPGTPAAKAGIKAGDQVVAVDDARLASVEDLARRVQASGGDELRIVVLRDGTEVDFKISPAPRGAANYTISGQRAGDLNDWIQKQARSGQGIHMRFVNPGIVFEFPRSVPANSSYTITRQGTSPAVLSVRRGDQSWIVTGQNLAELPEDMRPWVRQLLNLTRGQANPLPQFPPLLMPGPPDRRTWNETSPGVSHHDLRAKIDQLTRQADQLRRALEAAQVSETAGDK